MIPAIKNPEHPTLIEQNDLDEQWLWIDPYLEEILDRTGEKTTIDEIHTDAFFGTTQLWVFGRGFLITRCERTTLWIEWMGGQDMRPFLIPTMLWLESLARHNSCTLIKLKGRLGWVKVLKTFGYETQSVTLCKEVDYGRW